MSFFCGNARLSRQICPDPAGPLADLGLYLYAANDPVSLVDPFGLDPTAPEVACQNGGAAAIVKAGIAILKANTVNISGVGEVSLLPDKNGTHCNHFVQKLLEDCYDNYDFHNLQANDIITSLEHLSELRDSSWEKVDKQRAIDAASEGKLVIAGKHGNFVGTSNVKVGSYAIPVMDYSPGHVAIVVPESVMNASVINRELGYVWRRYDKFNQIENSYEIIPPNSTPPFVVQAGRSMGFAGINYAWQDYDSVEYYVYKDDCGCKE